MDNNNTALGEIEGGGALRHYTYYRPTILVLLKDHESHGYELAGRMTELGFDQRLASSIYKVLRDMETEELISSSWDMSRHGGPPRRVYALTAAGDQFLRDWVPALIRQRHALDAMLGLYSELEQTVARARRRSPSKEAAPRADTKSKSEAIVDERPDSRRRRGPAIAGTTARSARPKEKEKDIVPSPRPPRLAKAAAASNPAGEVVAPSTTRWPGRGRQ